MQVKYPVVGGIGESIRHQAADVVQVTTEECQATPCPAFRQRRCCRKCVPVDVVVPHFGDGVTFVAIRTGAMRFIRTVVVAEVVGSAEAMSCFTTARSPLPAAFQMSTASRRRELVELLPDDTEFELLMVVPPGGSNASRLQPKIIAATATVRTAFSFVFMHSPSGRASKDVLQPG